MEQFIIPCLWIIKFCFVWIDDFYFWAALGMHQNSRHFHCNSVKLWQRHFNANLQRAIAWHCIAALHIQEIGKKSFSFDRISSGFRYFSWSRHNIEALWKFYWALDCKFGLIKLLIFAILTMWNRHYFPKAHESCDITVNLLTPIKKMSLSCNQWLFI